MISAPTSGISWRSRIPTMKYCPLRNRLLSPLQRVQKWDEQALSGKKLNSIAGSLYMHSESIWDRPKLLVIAPKYKRNVVSIATLRACSQWNTCKYMYVHVNITISSVTEMLASVNFFYLSHSFFCEKDQLPPIHLDESFGTSSPHGQLHSTSICYTVVIC